jgi:hypothetical protein
MRRTIKSKSDFTPWTLALRSAIIVEDHFLFSYPMKIGMFYLQSDIGLCRPEVGEGGEEFYLQPRPREYTPFFLRIGNPIPIQSTESDREAFVLVPTWDDAIHWMHRLQNELIIRSRTLIGRPQCKQKNGLILGSSLRRCSDLLSRTAAVAFMER